MPISKETFTPGDLVGIRDSGYYLFCSNIACLYGEVVKYDDILGVYLSDADDYDISQTRIRINPSAWRGYFHKILLENKIYLVHVNSLVKKHV